jgi:pimeloyl-ACP methyl ester carboxylesterase
MAEPTKFPQTQPQSPFRDGWDTTTKSALVSINTHSLFLSVSGPPRHLGQPIVIILPGAGDTAASYPAVERLVAVFARILLYDRSGLGRSEDGPNLPSATLAAKELNAALKSAGIPPPFVLVGHSYGGIVAREYLHLYQQDVAGMVLAESSTERQCQYFRIPDPNIVAVMADLNFAQVTGLRVDSKISREEWRFRAAEMSRRLTTSQAEADGFVGVCQTLAEKKQYERQAMGSKPVSVIRCNSARDYWKIYEKGVDMGNGTEEERRAFRELLRTWDEIDKDLKEEQVRLSSNSHYIHIPDCGHNIQLIRPDVLAEEIRWVLQNLENGAKSIKASTDCNARK